MRLFFLCLFLFSAHLSAQYESDYIRALAGVLNGETEVSVENGRVDIVTDRYAIEVERAGKWKNSIGQALWYGLQTNRAPGIILILESKADYKHFIRLNSALNHAGLGNRVETWVYPNDFPGLELGSPTSGQTNNLSDKGAKTNYWLTSSSKKRHRHDCKWYEKSKGRYCSASEGTAAGCCN